MSWFVVLPCFANVRSYAQALKIKTPPDTAAPAADYQVACLLYCFNDEDKVLLLKRRRPPNLGLWSPPGGKLDVRRGESPYACAVREAREELGMRLSVRQLHLSGLVSETSEGPGSHWLMFLFEVKTRLRRLPPPHAEGDFALFDLADLAGLPLPATDQETIWPMFWRHRGGFFSANCRSRPRGRNSWLIEEVHG